MSEHVQRRHLERALSLVLLGLVVTFAVTGLVDPDLPGHLKYGLDHLEQGHLPLRDPYSYSVAPKAVWINHEWLFELLAAWLFRTLGGWSLVALQAGAWGLTAWLTLWLLRRASQDFVPGAILYLLFAAAAFAAVSIRPQLFTYLFFAVLLVLLELARSGRHWALLGFPPLFAAWVNMHGGFLAGLCILSAYAGGLTLDWLLRRTANGDLETGPERPGLLAGCAWLASACAFASTFLNPYRSDLWLFLGDSLGRPRSELITEWRSVEPDAQGLLFVLLILITGAALLARRDRVPLAHALVLVGTGAVALSHVRHAPFFAISACAFAPGAISDLYRRFVARPEQDIEPGDSRKIRAVAALLLLPSLALALSLPTRDTLHLTLRPTGSSTFPTGALRYMREHEEVRGRLLVHFDWAQLMIYEFHPRLRVFYDGRFRTVYDQRLEDEFFAFASGSEGWRRPLDAYDTEWVLVPLAQGAAERMRSQDDWRTVYEDAQAVLFRRRREGDDTRDTKVVGSHPPPELPFRPQTTRTGR